MALLSCTRCQRVCYTLAIVASTQHYQWASATLAARCGAWRGVSRLMAGHGSPSLSPFRSDWPGGGRGAVSRCLGVFSVMSPCAPLRSGIPRYEHLLENTYPITASMSPVRPLGCYISAGPPEKRHSPHFLWTYLSVHAAGLLVNWRGEYMHHGWRGGKRKCSDRGDCQSKEWGILDGYRFYACLARGIEGWSAMVAYLAAGIETPWLTSSYVPAGAEPTVRKPNYP